MTTPTASVITCSGCNSPGIRQRGGKACAESRENRTGVPGKCRGARALEIGSPAAPSVVGSSPARLPHLDQPARIARLSSFQ